MRQIKPAALKRSNTDVHREPVDAGAARAQIVNRTHRVVREQATRLREQKKRSRGLMAPLFFSSVFLMVLCYATWSVMAGYDLTPTGVPDASDQVLLLVLWSLPVTMVVLGMIWLRRSRGRNGGNEQIS